MIEKFKIYLSLLVIIAFLSGCSAIQSIKLVNGGEVVKNNAPDSVIPFTLEGGVILINAKLNHSDKVYRFIVDTGALTMISTDVAKELNLPKGIEVKAGGTGGNSKTINLVKLESVLVGGMEVKDCATGVTDFRPLFPRRVAGILGSNFLKYFKVTINYQKKELTLSQDTRAIATERNDIKIPFELDMMHGFAPIVECELDGNIKEKGVIDTGFYGFIALPTSIIKKSPSFKNGTVVTSDGSMSGGMFGMGERENYALRLNKIKIGNLQLQNIPATSHSHKDGQILVGNKFLEKYLVTLNYPAKEMTLRAVALPSESNILDFGLALTKKNNKTVVLGVWHNSSAFKKGLRVGDEIIRIDDIKTDIISSILELMIMFKSEEKKHIKIEFKNEKGRDSVILEKEEILPILGS